jgi:hypothetical protein
MGVAVYKQAQPVQFFPNTCMWVDFQKKLFVKSKISYSLAQNTKTMKQFKVPAFKGLFFSAAFILTVVLLTTSCGGNSGTRETKNASDTPSTLPHVFPADSGGGGSVLTGTVLEISASRTVSTVAGDLLAFNFGGNTYTGTTLSNGTASINIGSATVTGPVIVEGEESSTGAVTGRFINTLLNISPDTGYMNPSIFVSPAGKGIPVKIFATDLNGNPYSNAAVQLQTGGSNFGTKVYTHADGQILYGSQLTAGATYTVQLSGGTSSGGTGGNSNFTITATPKLCTSGCAYTGIAVFMRY